MPTIKITVKPATSVQRVFDAAQLAAAIHGKKPAIPWHDDTDKLVDLLWEAVADKVATSVKIDGVQTSGMKARIEAADITKRNVPSSMGPGRVLLEVKVGDDTVPIPVEIDEPAEEPEAADFDSLVANGDITFSNSKVKRLVTNDRHNSDKAASIFERGTGYKGHGATTAIGGVHAHVTNRTALGFKWAGKTLEIIGVGEKNDSAAAGNSGYDWTT